MSEHVLKMPRSVSPVARAGAGDISERELSRERRNLQSTPPARLQPVHPKKQLFFTPVSKFTCKSRGPSQHLVTIHNCIDELNRTPTRRLKLPPKATSMEDLTPTKRMRKEQPETDGHLPVVLSPSALGAGAGAAASRVARFMVVCAWRRRRDEVRCLRRTLESQVSCSERLRMQVVALKSLLDSDNAKVRLAMRELERLKQLLWDKDKEKAILEREKIALEDDVCAAEDRASEMSIGWRNCRNELESVRTAAAASERALAAERATAADVRAQLHVALTRISACEEEAAQLEEQLAAADEDAEARRAELEDVRREQRACVQRLAAEHNARLASGLEVAAQHARASRAERQTEALLEEAAELRRQLAEAENHLRQATEQLQWWPEPLTKLMGALRWWAGRGASLRGALLWSCVPATHGATSFTHPFYNI